MTFIVGMSKDEGAYMCVDFRVTDSATGKTVDDAAIKFLTVHYQPYETGPKALFAYTGLAILKDGSRVGDWIRETLRGENEVIDTSIAHLRDRMNRDIAPERHPLIVNILVVEPGGRRLFGGLSNVKPGWVVKDEFDYVMQELDEPVAIINGSGAFHIQPEDWDLLRSQLSVRPRRIHDHLKLLGTINERVASRTETVSPHCHVAFLPGDNRYQATSFTFDEGHPVGMQMPFIMQGIDLSFMWKHMSEMMRTGENVPFDDDEMNEQQKRRP